MQLDSVAALHAVDFLTILPGHGAPAVFGGRAHKDAALTRLLRRCKQQAEEARSQN